LQGGSPTRVRQMRLRKARLPTRLF
jgi:hypothetical protein